MAAAAVAAGGSYAASKQANKGNRRPSYITEGEQYAIDKARQISNRPYTPYTGQRVATLSQNEGEASQLARTGSAQGRSYLDSAGSELGKMSDYSGEAIDRYMNPYVESVLQPQLREANNQYERSRSALLNSKAGAWGGDRAAFETSELERTHQQNLADITGKTYAEAYDNAQKAFFTDQDRHMRAADAYRAVGGDISRMNTQQIQDLMATGGVQRALSQADLDFDYQQFAEARDWDTKNLEPLLQALGTGQSGERNRQPESNPWGQALGAAATVAGAYFTGGGNLGKTKTPSKVSEYQPNVHYLPEPASGGSP